jgi:restriction system protein
MTLRELARTILAESLLPLSARQVWDEAVKRGLDKKTNAKGKTPDAAVAAYLYTQAKKPNSDIVATGSKPALFSLRTAASTPVTPTTRGSGAQPPFVGESETVPNSRFYEPCLSVLRSHAPTPMGVSEIMKAAMAENPELKWKFCNGAVRASLLRAAKANTPIRQVPGTVPPLFFVGDGPVPETPPRPKQFSFLDCAQKVLREFGAKQPMHYRDITATAQEQGWLVTDSENPAATMNALIGTDIRKRLASRKPQIFAQHGKGFIGLAEWMSRGIRFQAEQHNKSVRDKLLATLHRMSPESFEKLVCALLEKMDFVDTEVTRLSGDGGIDVRGTWRIADGIQIKMAIQAKRWKANVQAPVVQAVRGALTGSERGMIITTSDFSKGAREEAEDPRRSSTISLVNGEQLVKLLEQYKVGVSSTPIEILEFDPDSDLFGNEKE